MNKKYSSITSIAFDIEHFRYDGEDITPSQVREVLLKRIAACSDKELLEATVNELVDTQEVD